LRFGLVCRDEQFGASQLPHLIVKTHQARAFAAHPNPLPEGEGETAMSACYRQRGAQQAGAQGTGQQTVTGTCLQMVRGTQQV